MCHDILNIQAFKVMVCVKHIFLLATLVAVTGCGTVNTVFRGDGVASRKLNGTRTYCTTIPRVYSGVSYGFCTLHGEPSLPSSIQAQYAVPGVIADLFVSGVMDTVLLPYTVYRQVSDGSIPIKKREFGMAK